MRCVRARVMLTGCFAPYFMTVALGLCLVAPPLHAEQPVPRSGHPFVALTAGGAFFGDPAMRRMYGTAPVIGVLLFAPLAGNVQLLAGVQYSSKSGMLVDDPVFERDADARLTIVPLVFGLRTNLVPGHRTRIMLGCAAEYCWLRESLLGTWQWGGGNWRRDPGYSLGFRFLLGPEWELGHGTWVVGSELSFGPRFSGFESDHGQWMDEMTTSAAHAYVGRRL